jgi:hypothetical protein
VLERDWSKVLETKCKIQAQVLKTKIHKYAQQKNANQKRMPKLIYSRIITLGILDQEDHKVR